MVYIYYFKFCTKALTPPIHYSRLLKLLPQQLQNKISRYQRWQDRYSSILGKIILRQFLMEFDFDYCSLDQLVYNSFGRPYFANEANCDFNISHSGEYVIVAFSRKVRVGIDIEQNIDASFEELENIFSANERDYLQQCRNPDEAFLRLWTRKEAIVKAQGCGLSMELKNVDVAGRLANIHQQNWFLTNIELDKGYSCSIATDADICLDRISMKPFNLSGLVSEGYGLR